MSSPVSHQKAECIHSATDSNHLSLTRLILLLLVGLFYAMAFLEVDPGETGDSFGDTFDTYLHSQPLHESSSEDNGLVVSNFLLIEPHSFLPLFSRCVYAKKLADNPLDPSPFTRRQRRHLLFAVWQI